MEQTSRTGVQPGFRAHLPPRRVGAYGLAGTLETVWLLPFATGNFLYISAADLIPELTKHQEASQKAVLTATFTLGLSLLLVVALAA